MKTFQMELQTKCFSYVIDINNFKTLPKFKWYCHDYHIHKNKIFAHNTLTPVEFEKFSRIYDILTEDLQMPNMIIFLDADLQVLKSRIAQRNRSFEHQISDDYLLSLKRDYNQYYDTLKAEGANVIKIDTTHLDFVQHADDYAYILNLVKPMIGGNVHE